MVFKLVELSGDLLGVFEGSDDQLERVTGLEVLMRIRLPYGTVDFLGKYSFEFGNRRVLLIDKVLVFLEGLLEPLHQPLLGSQGSDTEFVLQVVCLNRLDTRSIDSAGC